MANRYRSFLRCLAAIVAIVCAPQLAVQAVAQDRPVPEPRVTPPQRHGPPRGIERFRSFAERFRGGERDEDDLAELIELVAAWKMMKEVELSEEQTLKMLKLGREMREQGGKIKKQRERLLRELNKLLDNPDAKNEAIARQLQKLEHMDERRRRLVREYERKMRSGLTLREQAKLLIFKTRYEGEMRRRIE